MATELAASAAPNAIFAFIADCVTDGSLAALVAVQRLYEDMYGGVTFNYELKAPAGLALLRWGERGIDALYEAAVRSPTTKNLSIAIDVMATTATGESWLVGSHLLPRELVTQVLEGTQASPIIRDHARRRLVDLMLAIPDDDYAAHAAASGLSRLLLRGLDAAKLVFGALAARWTTMGEPMLNEFRRLLQHHPADEDRFQRFLENVPQLLDPMCFQVWPRPDLLGAKQPDFVVRRFDDTYLIVEIETPAKPIVTRGGQLSAAATQAVGQVTRYREFMLHRMTDIRKQFPEFREPDCLVIIGLESKLTPSQRQALAADNQSRGRLRVAGFDWLLQRAVTVRSNILDRVASVRGLRIN